MRSASAEELGFVDGSSCFLFYFYFFYFLSM